MNLNFQNIHCHNRKMVKIYTANIRYNGSDALNVTRKNHSAFAPEWGLIMAYKNGTIDKRKFKQKYTQYLWELYALNSDLFLSILEMQKVTFTCHPLAFCHRILLAEFFEFKFPESAKYVMERKKYLCKLNNI